VVHCKRLVERRDYLSPILRNFGWEPHWIESHDPGEIPRRHLLRFRFGANLLTVGEISVYLKHLEVFRKVAQSEAGLGFVIEDDAELPPDFPAELARCRAELPASFDLVFLGASCGFGESRHDGRPRLTRQDGARSMSGYLVTAAASRRLLAELDDRPMLEPIDLAVNRIIATRRLDVWWSEPPLLLNGSETGRFRHSLGQPWRVGVTRAGLSVRAGKVFDRIAAAWQAQK
jgi:hypothetical protein